jgi:exo-1,4-beta-D-glucosaminidase
VNSYYSEFKDLKASAKVYNLDLTEKYTQEVSLDIPADGVRKLFTIPETDGLTPTYFLSLRLTDAHDNPISSNFYWLSTKADVLDWDRSTWYFTPTILFADLSELGRLRKVKLLVASRTDVNGNYGTTHITIENPTETLAFAVHLKLMKPSRYRDPEADSDEIEVLPVLWDDNYFPLMPGERREITARYMTSDMERESRSSDVPMWAMRGGAPTVDVEGWNVLPISTATPTPSSLAR